jgi:hypothetical protein
MGQIQPQKALPINVAVTSMIIAGIRDKMGTWVPVRIVFKPKMGSNLHRSLIGEDGLVKLYRINIIT